MNAFQLKKIALLLSLSAAFTVHAAGLGNMTSSSKLGEPLNAEIELLSVAPSELSSIQATLASEQFYQDQLLEKPNSYPFIKIEVASNPQGQPILKLSSSQPITEAFLDMLIQVDWPTGRLVKEYTLLLDPPGFNANTVTEPVNLPSADASTNPSTNTAAKPTLAAPTVAKPPVVKPPVVKPTAKPAPVSAASNNEPTSKAVDNDIVSVTVKKGDNLHALAEQMRPDNVTPVQMLAALYQTNPQAFEGQNMNRLKVGKILRMPTNETLNALDQASAQRIVNSHFTQWQAYKNGLANAVQQSPADRSSGTAQSTAGKVESAAQANVPPASASKDVLKLSAGEAPNKTLAAESTGNKALQDKLNGLQEELIAKDNAIQEEKSRTAELAKQIADMKKLLALKNDALATMQSNAGASAKPSEPTPSPAPENTNVAATPAETAQPTDSSHASESAKPEAPAATTDKQTVQSASDNSAAKPATAAKPAAPVVVDAEEAPQSPFTSFLAQRLKQLHPGVLTGLIVLPILGVLWLWTRVRRKKAIHTFEEAIMTSPATEMQSNTVFGHTQATSGDTSFLTDFSQSAVGGMIDAHEVDPIAEAEVYMAYGRDAQAEEILKDAIQKDPRRQELKVKLLEIYQATGNASAFEGLANTLYTQIGANADVWPQVAAMGRQMDAHNPLYREVEDGGEHTSSAAEAQAMTAEDFELATPDTDPFATANQATTHPISPTDGTLSASNLNDSLEDQAVTNAGLQPKPIQLPALDFEEIPTHSDASTRSATASSVNVTGEMRLAETDTVFERLPELSFELDPPTNDATGSTQVSSEKQDQGFQTENSSVNSTFANVTDAPAVDMPSSIEVSENVAPLATGDVSAPQATVALSDDDPLTKPIETNNPAQPSVDTSPFAAIQRETQDLEADAMTLTLGAPDETDSLSAGTEEVNTKLDLIKAYIDMEDLIGAKELIDEVLTEGSPAQQQAAKALLEKIA